MRGSYISKVRVFCEQSPLNSFTVVSCFCQTVETKQDWLHERCIRRLMQMGIPLPYEEESDESWDKNMALLVDFCEQHGHMRVPLDLEVLGEWTARQQRK